MSKFNRTKRNNIIIVVVLAAAALALIALFSGIGRTPNKDNLLSLDFKTYESDYGYEIIANDNGSLTFDGEFKASSGITSETVEYEKVMLSPDTYTVSTGTNGNPYTYCMIVSYVDENGESAIAYSDSGSASTFTIAEKQEVTISIVVNDGAEIDGITIYPTLNEGKEPIKFFSTK